MSKPAAFDLVAIRAMIADRLPPGATFEINSTLRHGASLVVLYTRPARDSHGVTLPREHRVAIIDGRGNMSSDMIAP